MMNDTLDRWIQRVTLATVLALAAMLLTTGARLYVVSDPTPDSSTADGSRSP